MRTITFIALFSLFNFFSLTAQVKIDSTELFPFVPTDHEILGFKYGDLNKDALKNDVILALKRKDESNSDADRPLLLLTRKKNGSLQLERWNNTLVMCQACGGIYGDPFSGLAIKNGYFSVEHYGGSNWRWFDVTTFKYDTTKKEWFLHQLGTETYHTSKPDEVQKEIKRREDFGEVRFSEYGRN
ncbi:MAG: hypothetical protein AAFO07_24785 [Bacteroidota bacterium]